jgi:acetyl esterase
MKRPHSRSCESSSPEPPTHRIDSELISALLAFQPTDLADLDTTRQRRSAAAADAARAAAADPRLRVSDHVVPAREETPALRIRLYRPTSSAHTAALLWIHGGGFVTGGIEQNDARCRELANATGSVVVSPEYRLAPEHRAPAALDDCWSTLLWIVEQATTFGVDVDRIAVGGSSAGACLAAGLTLRARDAGGPRICFQALLFPVLDDRPSTWSPGTRIWDEANATGCWSLYLGPRHDDDAVSMYIAPGRTEHLSGLPSAYVLSAEFDVVRDQAVDYATRLLRANVATELHVVPGTYHSFDAVVPDAAISRRVRAEYIGALTAALTRSPTVC